ncbi:MAG: Nif3-like dinuclear metal center hexameric protein [Pirellulales bacterium]
MMTVAEIQKWFDHFTPLALAESWDNVGLLMGDPAASVQRVMTCLTVTEASAAEAVRERVDLVVTHHPLPFKPLPRVTTLTTPGRLVWNLARGGVSVFSPHTAFDSAAEGINQQLAELLQLEEIAPLMPTLAGSPPGGTGRKGHLPNPIELQELASRVCHSLRVPGLHRVGEASRVVRSVGIACGSAGSLLGAAKSAGCEVFLTGEATFHTCLEAEALGVSLLLPGHHATERRGVEKLAERLATDFPQLTVWASRDERDPLEWTTE